MSLTSKVEQLIEEQKLYRTEGHRGVENLCKLVSCLGYKDTMYFGHLSNGSSTGDLINFLEDNPGVIENIQQWIMKQNNTDWEEELEKHLLVGSEEETDE